MRITISLSQYFKRILPLVIMALGLVSGFSCKGEKEPPTRMNQVMAIHDSVMPRMSEIGRLVARLKPLADSTAQGQEYEKAMRDLQEAHTAMMDWMKVFGERFDYDEIMQGKELTPQKQEWLLEEEVKVKEMAEKVNNSIANAEAVLKKQE
jgi:hypothetical protein